MIEAEHVRATRAAYDEVAADYAELVRDEMAAIPWERAVLAVFAELVTAGGGGPVADLGCGPGRVTAHLHGLGLDCSGIDLSPGMIEVARRTYPELRFEVGSIAALDLPDGGLAGAVAWYSIIHTPPEQLPGMFAEFHRVLAPGGHLQLAFHVGDERRHLDHAYGHDVSYDSYRLPPERITAQLGAAGFTPVATVLREPRPQEKAPQSYLTFRRR